MSQSANTAFGACSIAIGVDVGGTFTKAVAVRRAGIAEPLALHSVATTHTADSGVAAGVIEAVIGVANQLGEAKQQLGLVCISTTQAVNALLEGDIAKVGILALSDQRNARRARKRTRVKSLKTAPGRELSCLHELVVFEPGSAPSDTEIKAAIERLQRSGAEALAISHAFGVDDPTIEKRALAVAQELQIPACAGHQLSGLYGLELRTQTAAINASILPTMQRTAHHVQAALDDAGVNTTRLVVRGDGGATPLERLGHDPVKTLFSGPAASVAGALQTTHIDTGLVIEHGGTSTNISAIVDGKPILEYIHVMDFSTSVRALDVHILGLAGGSLIRRSGRDIYEFGPRSAHQAGLHYSCFMPPLKQPRAVWISPQPGDPDTYLVVEGSDGTQAAVTPTCFANALGLLKPGDPAFGDQNSAQLAVEAVAELIGQPWRELASAALTGAAGAVVEMAKPLLERFPQIRKRVVTAGGAAGVLGPSVAAILGAEEVRAPHAAVISSIGSALTLLRHEVERTVPSNSKESRELCESEAVEAARALAITDGADPATLDVEVEYDRQRATVRAVATGSLEITQELEV